MSVQDVLVILRRRLWIIVLLVAVSLGIAYYISLHTPTAWRAEAQMILVQRAAPVVTVNQGGGGNASSTIVDNVDTQVALVENQGMAVRTINYLKNYSSYKIEPGPRISDASALIGTLTPQDLQKRIEASAIPDTNIFEVAVEADDRQDAIDLANAICRAFIKWKEELAKKSASKTLETLKDRVKKAREQMVDAEQKELNFKRQAGLVNVNEQQANILQEYMKRAAQVSDLSQDLSVQKQRVASLRNALNSANSKIQNGKGVRDDSLVLALQQQVTQLEIEHANAKLRYTADYPFPEGPAQIGKRLAEVKRRLASAMQNTLNNTASLESQKSLSDSYNQAQIELMSTQAKYAAAAQSEAKLHERMADIPQSSMDYARLSRNADVARQLYTTLQSGLNAARLDQDAANSNVDVADWATAPRKPLRPDRTRDLLFGGAVGLFLAVVMVFLLEQSDRRVRTVEEMRSLIRGPVVGSIPELSRGEMRSLTQGKTAPRATEAYSMIWANLSLATRGQREEDGTASRGGQVMLITSSLPGEGKSFTAAQLARNIAQSGKQVILVDADLRRPMQNRLFHMNETIGLANVLSGTASLDDALVDSGTENLTLLHCGTSSRNPTELISSEQMSALLEALRQEADVIIVDAPACAVVADALFIAPYIDTIVHVIGVGQVDSALVRDTTAALAAAAPKIMTYLLNRAPSGSSSPYKYYQSYSSWHSPRPMAAVAARSSASEADAVRTVRTPDAAANEGDENRTIRIYETGPDEPEKEIF